MGRKTLNSRRKALKLTQKEAADLVGLLPKTVSALESDPDRCSLEMSMPLAPEADHVLKSFPWKPALADHKGNLGIIDKSTIMEP